MKFIEICFDKNKMQEYLVNITYKDLYKRREKNAGKIIDNVKMRIIFNFISFP